MIVLYTDFGLAGPYSGQVEAVLHAQAPGVPVVSLFANLPPFDIRAAAYLLPAYTAGFPPGTVFLCVVDPGVGSTRPGVAARIDGRWFVGPNEGLFALQARRGDLIECWLLPVPETASPVFHGRDVFAPQAARLARGLPPAGDGCAAASLLRPEWPDDLPEVVYIDHYGNAITGLRAATLAGDANLAVNGQPLKNARTFADVPEGTGFWYANSNGLVELAVNRGRADELLGLAVGSTIEVS